MQVEAHYVYSIMKATLMSQQNDPLVKALMKKHQLKTFKLTNVDWDGTMNAPYQFGEVDAKRKSEF